MLRFLVVVTAASLFVPSAAEACAAHTVVPAAPRALKGAAKLPPKTTFLFYKVKPSERLARALADVGHEAIVVDDNKQLADALHHHTIDVALGHPGDTAMLLSTSAAVVIPVGKDGAADFSLRIDPDATARTQYNVLHRAVQILPIVKNQASAS